MTPLSESLPLFPVCVCGDTNCTIPYGECHCGCGGITKIADRASNRDGIIKGLPQKYLFNHDKRVIPTLSDESPFDMEGILCRRISLTQGQFAIVWASDYKWLMQWKWSARFAKRYGHYYALRNATNNEGKRHVLSMHRAIIGVGIGDGGEVDHKNHKTLDNRRSNLRYVERNQNQWNANMRKDNTSGYKGVSWHETNGKWRVQICIFGKSMHIGYFYNIKDAHKAYCDAAEFYFGEFAKVI
jgi:hypothetical protein